MASTMLAKRYITIDKRRLHRREGRRSHILLAQQLVDRPSRRGSQEHPVGVDPAVAFGSSTTDEDRTWSAEGDQFIGIDGKIIGMLWTGIFEEIAGHPVVLLGSGYVFQHFAPVAAIERRPTSS